MSRILTEKEVEKFVSIRAKKENIRTVVRRSVLTAKAVHSLFFYLTFKRFSEIIYPVFDSPLALTTWTLEKLCPFFQRCMSALRAFKIGCQIGMVPTDSRFPIPNSRLYKHTRRPLKERARPLKN